MESQDQHGKASNEEMDDMHGTGRSYECVFCKRGFTTAQALGGRMNIHRKDRTRIRINNISTTRPPPPPPTLPSLPLTTKQVQHHEDYFDIPKLYPPLFLSCPPPPLPLPFTTHMDYPIYFPQSTTSKVADYIANYVPYRKPEEFSSTPSGEEWGSSLEVSVTSHGDYGGGQEEGKEEDELDLELRDLVTIRDAYKYRGKDYMHVYSYRKANYKE